MRKVRVIAVPDQGDVRVIVLSVVLWPDHVALRAIVESDHKEVEDPVWEDDQADMFSLDDDLGTEYERSGAGGSGDNDLHVWEWEIPFYPAVPEDAKTLTVRHIAGSVTLTIPPPSN
jgi:hypothetical protein